MLKIAKSVEYAIIALRYIDKSSERDCITAKEISQNERISFELLSKILQKLVKAEIIISTQGSKGGYRLNIEPKDLSLIEITEALDQSIRLTDCMIENPTINDCQRLNDCCLRSPLAKVQDKIVDLFAQTKLLEILN
jgi:Rrf2 family protein